MSQILIIEDEPRIAAFVAKGLKAAGYSGHIQSSGAIGAQLAVTDDFDLVILDVGLPDIDGFEALNRLRGQGVTTPVIMLTARSSVTDTVAGLEGRCRRLDGETVQLRGAAGPGSAAAAQRLECGRGGQHAEPRWPQPRPAHAAGAGGRS